MLDIPRPAFKFAGAVAAFGFMSGSGSLQDRALAGLMPATIAYAGMWAGEQAANFVNKQTNGN
jgi:hypothetical protein